MEKFERRVIVGDIKANCWIIVCPKTKIAAVIDPGENVDRIKPELDKMQVASVSHIFLTHGHFDHVGQVRELCEAISRTASKPLICIHEGDKALYLDLKKQGEMFGFQYSDPLPIDIELKDEQEFAVGELKIKVIHMPGHSPGGCAFHLFGDPSLDVPETVYTGDSLFKGSIGRTDLWGGNHESLMKAIRNNLMTLTDFVRICPGHGAATTVGDEKKSNPFLGYQRL